MPTKKLFVPLLIGICLIGLIFGSYKAIAMNSEKVADLQPDKTTSAPVTPLLDKMEQQSEAELNSTPNVSPAPVNVEPNKQQDQSTTDKINALIAKGEVIEAKEGYTYAQQKIIAIDKNVMVTLEGYRVVVDQSSYTTGKYYVIVDFSILNGKSNYISSLSNFVLSDSRDYTYSPTLAANTRGDISGEMKLGDFKRGEIAFYVPGSETQLELIFNTGSNTVRTISFNFDTNSLINPPLPN